MLEVYQFARGRGKFGSVVGKSIKGAEGSGRPKMGQIFICDDIYESHRETLNKTVKMMVILRSEFL